MGVGRYGYTVERRDRTGHTVQLLSRAWAAPPSPARRYWAAGDAAYQPGERGEVRGRGGPAPGGHRRRWVGRTERRFQS